jgi:hypothetical protein
LADVPNFYENIAKDSRYFPALVAVLVLGVMLLFFDKLSDSLKTWFVPSLVGYLLGFVRLFAHNALQPKGRYRTSKQRHPAAVTILDYRYLPWALVCVLYQLQLLSRKHLMDDPAFCPCCRPAIMRPRNTGHHSRATEWPGDSQRSLGE